MDNCWGDFCTYCGNALKGDFPRVCSNGHYTYASPVTVGIALQPVRDQHRTGILVVQRNINPFKGHYALPGGFVDQGELSQPAAIRELFEETGIRQTKATYFTEVTGGSHRDTDIRKHNMYFYVTPSLDMSEIDLQTSNSETQSLAIFYLSDGRDGLINADGENVTLCFASHHKAAFNYLQTLS